MSNALQTRNDRALWISSPRVISLALHPDVVAIIAPVAELQRGAIFREEIQEVERAVASRRAEYTAGRNLARLALASLGIAAGPIPRCPDRSPRWPSGVTGSISHTAEWVLVSVTNSTGIRGIGADIEGGGGVSGDLGEIIRSRGCDPSMDDTAIFSAKESVFKAVNPISGEFLDFADVAIRRHGSGERFVAAARPGLESGALVARGIGLIRSFNRLTLTCFIVPTVTCNQRDGFML